MDPLLIVAGFGIGLLVGMTGALVGTILLGSIPGISIGSHLTVRLPAGLLRNALGLVMVLSALALFDKAGIELPLAVVIAVPVAFVGGLLTQALTRARRIDDPAAPSA